MKKTIKFMAMALAMMFTLAGCGSEAALTKDEALPLAEKHVQMIAEGDYASVVADCTDAVARQIDAAAMADAYNMVAATAGEYVGIYSVTYQAREGMATVLTVAEYENTGISISLTYDNSGKIRGIWFNTAAVDYELTDNDILTEHEISVGEHDIKGVVTLPDNTDSYPVAVLVQGSGASDFDETIGANKPFKEIAHYLAEKGIATVRINKRFYQKPALSHDKLTIYDEYMDDVYAAVEYAKENISADVYVIGHSQGAMSAPKIALDNELKGVVMMAGTIRGLEDIVYDQNMAVLALNEEYSKSEKEKITKAFDEGVAAVKALQTGDTEPVLGIPAQYWLSLRDLDAENILKNQLTVPVLAIQGTADFQVYMDKDFEYMQTVLADKENIEFVSYDGLNHLFMPQSIPGAVDTSEYAAENHIPDYVLEDIAQFILDSN